MKRENMTPRILRVFETVDGWDEVAFTLEEETPPRVYLWTLGLGTNSTDPLLARKRFEHDWKWKHTKAPSYQQLVLYRKEEACAERLYKYLDIAKSYADVCKELLK